MDALMWFLILSPLLVNQGSAQALPRPLFPALPQPLPGHMLQMLAPEAAQEGGFAPSAFVFEVMACPLLASGGKPPQ